MDGGFFIGVTGSPRFPAGIVDKCGLASDAIFFGVHPSLVSHGVASASFFGFRIWTFGVFGWLNGFRLLIPNTNSLI